METVLLSTSQSFSVFKRVILNPMASNVRVINGIANHPTLTRALVYVQNINLGDVTELMVLVSQTCRQTMHAHF